MKSSMSELGLRAWSSGRLLVRHSGGSTKGHTSQHSEIARHRKHTDFIKDSPIENTLGQHFFLSNSGWMKWSRLIHLFRIKEQINVPYFIVRWSEIWPIRTRHKVWDSSYDVMEGWGTLVTSRKREKTCLTASELHSSSKKTCLTASFSLIHLFGVRFHV